MVEHIHPGVRPVLPPRQPRLRPVPTSTLTMSYCKEFVSIVLFVPAS